MAYTVGHISGGHFNPAVTLGLVLGGRHPGTDLIPYWVVQVFGAIAAGAVLYVIASGAQDFAGPGGFATNGYREASPQGYSMMVDLVTEILLTAVLLGATSLGAPVGFSPIAIGLGLTLIHLISIPVTNLSVNPARSTGVALFAEGPALAQLWLFWVVPLVDVALGALIWQAITTGD